MKGQKCEICFSFEKGKRLNCINCKILACPYCIPSDLEERICILCLREKIKEELIEENREKCKNLKNEVISLQVSAQNHQIEIELLVDAIVKNENLLKSSEISHLERVSNLQINIERTKRNLVPYSHIENLEKAFEDVKNNEKIYKNRYKQICDNIENEQNEIESLHNLEIMLEQRIFEIKHNLIDKINYEEDLRHAACQNCLRRIKIKFGDQIKDGKKENDSIFQSVMDAEKQENPQNKESNKKSSILDELKKRSTYKSIKKIDDQRPCCIIT